jgi:hypothetical protein
MTDFQAKRNCKHFEDCSAPMCPCDTGVANTAWFADEPICRLQNTPEWVKRQRKIAKAGGKETAGYFTLAMLERNCVIGKKISGIDPDGTETERKNSEQAWLEKHPPIKPKTREMREKLAARIRFQKGNPL